MVVIVYHGLPNVQSRLTYEVLQFLPAAVGGNLSSQSDKSRLEISWIESAYSLEEHNEFIIRSAVSWSASLFPAKKRHFCRQISKSLVPMMGSGSCCSPDRRCSLIRGADGSGMFVVRQTMAVFSILKGHRRCETVGVQLVRPGCGRLGLQLEQLLCSRVKSRCWGFTVSAGHSRHMWADWSLLPGMGGTRHRRHHPKRERSISFWIQKTNETGLTWLLLNQCRSTNWSDRHMHEEAEPSTSRRSVQTVIGNVARKERAVRCPL